MNPELTVLVVDDNEDLLETFAMILKRHGFFVETAESGLAAVNKYKKRRFDVTLMDIVMPGIDGVEASRRIKEIYPEAAIILMTGYSNETLLKAARNEGARQIVHKPVKIDRLIQLITDVAGVEPILLVNDEVDTYENLSGVQYVK